MKSLKTLTLFAALAVVGTSVAFAQPGENRPRGPREGRPQSESRGGQVPFRNEMNKLRHVDTLTSVTAEQKTKLDALAKKSQEKFDKAREELREAMRKGREAGAGAATNVREVYDQKFKPVVDEIDTELKSILTAAQYSELEKKAEQDRARGPQGPRGEMGNRPGGDRRGPGGPNAGRLGDRRGPNADDRNTSGPREGRGPGWNRPENEEEEDRNAMGRLGFWDKLTSVSAEQKVKLEELSKSAREKMKQAREEVRETYKEAKDATEEATRESRQKMRRAYQEKIKPVTDEMEAKLKDILTPEQADELTTHVNENRNRFRERMNERPNAGRRGERPGRGNSATTGTAQQ